MPIYCDESGYTGVNLLEPNQPHFIYGALNINSDEANEFVSKIKSEYKLQGPELKGANLIKFSNGRKAIMDVFDAYKLDMKAVAFEKKFTLACKYLGIICESLEFQGVSRSVPHK